MTDELDLDDLRSLEFGPNTIGTVVENVVDQVQAFDVKVYPAAEQLIAHYLRRGQVAGTVANAADASLCAAAFVLAGAEQAHAVGEGVVTTAHVKMGWQTALRCPGNRPPHKCLQRSILQRADDLKAQLPHLDDITLA